MNFDNISRDFHNFWGISGAVFRTPYRSPADFHASASTETFFRRLSLSLLNFPAFVWLYGPSGIGKTHTCLYLYQELPTIRYDVLYYAVSDQGSRASGRISAEISRYLGGSLEGAEPLRELDLEKRQLIVIVDAKISLGSDLAAEIGELAATHGQKMGFVIASPDRHSEQPELSGRVTASYELSSYDANRTHELIGHYLGRAGIALDLFGRDAIGLIQEKCRGIPRAILLLCEQCLIEGFLAGSHKITRHIVELALGTNHPASPSEPQQEFSGLPQGFPRLDELIQDSDTQFDRYEARHAATVPSMPPPFDEDSSTPQNKPGNIKLKSLFTSPITKKSG